MDRHVYLYRTIEDNTITHTQYHRHFLGGQIFGHRPANGVTKPAISIVILSNTAPKISNVTRATIFLLLYSASIYTGTIIYVVPSFSSVTACFWDTLRVAKNLNESSSLL